MLNKPKQMTEENFNLDNYIFKEDVKTVEMPVTTFWGLVNLVDQTLQEETKRFHRDKFSYVDKDGNRKTKTKKNENSVEKIFDIEKSLADEGVIYRTEKGQFAFKLKVRVDALRMEALSNNKMVERKEITSN